MEFTGERCILGKSPKQTEKEHLDRYNFAKGYVKDKIVLDIACGSGYGTKILSEEAKYVVGVDISEESISYAIQNFKSKKTEFLLGNAANLNKIKNEAFDIIISFETIEHLANYQNFLEELKRVLKKEGLLIISTPNKKYSSPNKEKPVIQFHIIEFYKTDFENLLSQYFHNIKFYGQDIQGKFKLIKKKIASLVPRFVRQRIIPKKFKDSYSSNIVDRITDQNPENCRYLIAICKN